MSEQKRMKLTPLAKALVMHFPRCDRQLRNADYYLRYPVYSLKLRSHYNNVYTTEIQKNNQNLTTKELNFFKITFENLHKLAQWFKVDYLSLRFEDFTSRGREKVLISAYRQIWSEVYPDAKINLMLDSIFKAEHALPLIEELGTRLYNLECSPGIVHGAPEMHLNSCVFNKETYFRQLKQILKKHKIKELKFDLEKLYRNSDLISSDSFDDFPTNYALKRLEITYKTESPNDKWLDPIVKILKFLPNLTNLRLGFKYKADEYNLSTFDEIAKITNDALDHIGELREKVFKDHPSIELEIYSSFEIKIENESELETFNQWAESIKSHPEVNNSNRIEPAFDFSHNSTFSLDNLSLFGPHEEGKYYKKTNWQWLISLRWKRKNFAGILYMYITECIEYEEYDDVELGSNSESD